jgi:hypothetical protein
MSTMEIQIRLSTPRAELHWFCSRTTEEPVCDDLNGALYGRCVAYCEAMDCHLGDRFASDRACEQVLTNYMTHSDGGMPPCHGPVEGNEDDSSSDTGDTGESSQKGETTIGNGEEGGSLPEGNTERSSTTGEPQS